MHKIKKPVPQPPFPVVGIAVSSGCLDALKLFIGGIPRQSSMAYLLQELNENTDDDEMLLQAISKACCLPVSYLDNIENIQPEQLYIIPTNKRIAVNRDGLLVEEYTGAAPMQHRATDFFATLGRRYQSFAVGVQLPGIGYQLNNGIHYIHDCGGLVIGGKKITPGLEDSSLVDFELDPEKIAEKLITINRSFYAGLINPAPEIKTSPADAAIYRQLLKVLLQVKGVDFAHHQKSIVARKIQQRMARCNCHLPTDYLLLLRKDAVEQTILCKELLKTQGGFAPYLHLFDSLHHGLFPVLARLKKEGEMLRIWVPGCSCGEEVFTLAIYLQQYLVSVGKADGPGASFKIFATDIADIAIETARNGIYSKEAMLGVNNEIKEEYFVSNGTHYRVTKSIRAQCVFAKHDLLKDPAFANINFICCRNVLFQMSRAHREKALRIFYKALSRQGLLLLGPADGGAGAPGLFKPIHEEIFEKQDSKKYVQAEAAITGVLINEALPAFPDLTSKAVDIFQLADQTILEKFGPPGVLIDEAYDIIEFRGITAPWLNPAEGDANFQLPACVRKDIAGALMKQIDLARRLQKSIKTKVISNTEAQEKELLELEVIPLLNEQNWYSLVLFKTLGFVDNTKVKKLPALKASPGQGKHTMPQPMEHLTKALLQQHQEVLAIADKYEAINEKLQNANEELLSGSEELLYTNAELERTRERLQENNISLEQLNDTLLNRQQELTKARNYIEGVFVTIREPLLVIDHAFKVTMATAGFFKKFKLTATQVEQQDIFTLPGSLWQHPELKNYIKQLQANVEAITEIQLNTGEGDEQKSFVVSARKMESVEGNATVLLSFEDVSDKRKLEENMVTLHRLNEELIHSNSELEEFASIASHDLQEPLRKILTFVNVITEKEFLLDDNARQYILKIGGAGVRMQQIIRDLLSYAKITDSEKILAPIDLNIVLQNALTDLEVVIQEKKAIVKLQQLPVIPGIGLYINQLFYNLVNNALKFSKKDLPPIIEIASRALSVEELQQQDDLDASIPFVEITVRDNGIGLDTKYAAKIFQPFQRINTRTEYPGTGIGLALCRKIVLQHRGKIYVTSEPGVGTTFHILLPLQV